MAIFVLVYARLASEDEKCGIENSSADKIIGNHRLVLLKVTDGSSIGAQGRAQIYRMSL